MTCPNKNYADSKQQDAPWNSENKSDPYQGENQKKWEAISEREKVLDYEPKKTKHDDMKKRFAFNLKMIDQEHKESKLNGKAQKLPHAYLIFIRSRAH